MCARGGPYIGRDGSEGAGCLCWQRRGPPECVCSCDRKEEVFELSIPDGERPEVSTRTRQNETRRRRGGGGNIFFLSAVFFGDRWAGRR